MGQILLIAEMILFHETRPECLFFLGVLGVW